MKPPGLFGGYFEALNALGDSTQGRLACHTGLHTYGGLFTPIINYKSYKVAEYTVEANGGLGNPPENVGSGHLGLGYTHSC